MLGVSIREHNIIYKLIDDLKELIGERMPTEEVMDVVGRANVQQEFLINIKTKKIPVAGCRVQMGKIDQGERVRVQRGGVHGPIVYDGLITELKHLKNEVSQVQQGKECGIMVGDTEVRFDKGDVISSYKTRQEKMKVEWETGF